jgi:hypothetical protein
MKLQHFLIFTIPAPCRSSKQSSPSKTGPSIKKNMIGAVERTLFKQKTPQFCEICSNIDITTTTTNTGLGARVESRGKESWAKRNQQQLQAFANKGPVRFWPEEFDNAAMAFV